MKKGCCGRPWSEIPSGWASDRPRADDPHDAGRATFTGSGPRRGSATRCISTSPIAGLPSRAGGGRARALHLLQEPPRPVPSRRALPSPIQDKILITLPLAGSPANRPIIERRECWEVVVSAGSAFGADVQKRRLNTSFVSSNTNALCSEVLLVKAIQPLDGLVNILVLVIHLVMARTLDYEQVPFVGGPLEEQLAVLKL